MIFRTFWGILFLLAHLGRESAMLRTVILGSCVSVQGTFIRQLANGRIVVRVGQRIYQGFPVAPVAD